MKRWRCKVCGYIHTGEEPPEKCPVCGAPKSQFELLEDDSAEAMTAPGHSLKCQVCGYIHREGEAPEKCPVCGAPQNRFEGQNATAPGKVETDSSQEPATAQPTTAHSLTRTIKPMSQLVAKADLLTRWHGHPIAVHIPNGVLPVMLFFTLLAILFKSEPLAVAAKYNCIFVAISMPLVLITGFIDWFNRFDGYLTSIFKIKIACGAIVTALTLVLALWWATNPQIYLSGKPILYLFILINFLDFAAAAVAGFYGGKLVFKE